MANDPTIQFSKQDIEKLIAAHDGDMALLYLYSRCRGVLGEDAARDLNLTSAAVDAAEEKLLRLGLTLGTAPAGAGAAAPVTGKQRVLPEPAEERPDYSPADIADRAEHDAAFQTVVYEATQIMGRTLSSNDMKILFGMYDYLDLPAEVIMVLMNYSVQKHEAQRGDGRRPTMRFIEKEAFRWASDGITSLDEADRYIAEKRDMDTRLIQAAQALDIQGRILTETEIRYLTEWIEMGFGPDMIHAAYDRTITNTGKRTWKYIDTILESWKDKGIFTLKDLEEKDRPASKKKASGSVSETRSKKDSLNNFLKKLDRERGDSK